jgi:hypothetical protein
VTASGWVTRRRTLYKTGWLQNNNTSIWPSGFRMQPQLSSAAGSCNTVLALEACCGDKSRSLKGMSNTLLSKKVGSVNCRQVVLVQGLTKPQRELCFCTPLHLHKGFCGPSKLKLPISNFCVKHCWKLRKGRSHIRLISPHGLHSQQILGTSGTALEHRREKLQEYHIISHQASLR